MAQAAAKKATQTDTPVLVREDRGPVAILTLNRPASRNSLSEAMLGALATELDEISGSKTIRAVVLSAVGPVFSAGHDIRELRARRTDADGGEAYFKDIFSRCTRVMQKVIACPKPVIAAVEGIATAAGCQLVATCDLAVAGNGAKFCTPGVNIGLFCSTPAVAIARNIGRKRAMEMLLLGDMIDADDACRYGLVNRVVPRDDVMPVALELAGRIASKSSASNAIGKKTFYDQIDAPLAAAYDQACLAMVDNMLLQVADEGLSAFLEKREPNWRGA